MFNKITAEFLAAPQIGIAHVEEAKAQGVTTIVNNRPDGEEPDAPQDADMRAAAEAAGLGYHYIPVTHAGFSHGQIDALNAALEEAEGTVLAYCRSGTRSTLLWSLAQAKAGRPIDEIASSAANGGYDISSIRPMLDTLASGAR